MLDKGSTQIILHSALKTGPEVITLFHAQCWHRVRTDIEKSWKMTLVLENSWNSKKVQFVFELSLNFEKKLLGNHKKSLKMIETVSWM